MEFVGRRVKKEFQGYGTFFGSVKSFDPSTGFFKIAYDDGDSEEMDLSEVTPLLVSSEEVRPSSMVESSRRLGRKPKKRARFNKGKIDNSVIETGISDMLVDGGEGSEDSEMNEAGLNLNEGLDLNDDGFNYSNDDHGGDNSGGSKVCLGGLDLNEAVNLEMRDEGLDLNTGENLGKRKEIIDLNVDASEDVENFSSEKKDIRFDLNLGLSEDEIRNSDDIPGQVGEKEKFSASEEKQEMEEIGGDNKDALVSVVGEKGNLNLNVEIEEEAHEKTRSAAVDNENDLPVSVPIGRRGRRRREVSNNNVDLTVPEMVNMDAGNGNLNINSTNNYSTPGKSGSDVVGRDNENPGSVPRGRRGRNRRETSENNITSTTPETGLRRSSRRVNRAELSRQDQVFNTAGLDGGTNLLSSPAISTGFEENFQVLGREKPEELVHLPPKVELPLSSGKLDINGVLASDVLSVYAFLRSFSTSLFLSPFELDDFVASVKCNDSTLLFDSIHVSLLRTLRKHLESLANEGSLPASNCLRSLNWDLLDLITWPMFVVEYLLLYSSGCISGLDPCHLKHSQSDYYKQSVSTKIGILRQLCDDAIEVDAVRSEINRRTMATEQHMDFDRMSKTDRSKKRKPVLDVASSSCITEEDVEETADWNSDECCLCKMDGSLICCDGCPAAFHSRCVGVVSNSLPEGDWYCPECAISKDKPWMKVGKSIRGAELLGIDPYDRHYYSSCGYLLVSELGDDEYSFWYYHITDLPALIDTLESVPFIYNRIITAISKHWKVVHGVAEMKDARSYSIHSPFPVKRQLPCMHPARTELHVKDRIVTERKSDEKSFFSTYSSNIELGVPEQVNMVSESVSHGMKVESRLASSEGSTEVSQAVTNTDKINESGMDCSKQCIGMSYDSEIPHEGVNTADHYLIPNTLEVEQRTNLSSANHGQAPSTTDLMSIMPKVHCGTKYVNFYEFARTAASVVEELMRKSSDKTSDIVIRSAEEVVTGQLKVISNKFVDFWWPDTQNLNANTRKEKCGWCFTCQVPEEERDCLFILNDSGPPIENFTSEVLGIRSTKNRKGHLIDVMCYIICIEDRLQGLLLGPWLDPHYSKLWRKGVLGVSDIASLKRFLLKLESNLHRRAFSADWLKYVDSVTTVGSASHVVSNSVRAFSKHGISRKKARCFELVAASSQKSASGLGLFWWRGGQHSRQLFNWKVLPRSLASKAARQGGCKKIPGILYPDSGEFAKRSKYIAWRASVETSRSVEQLALQVRELESNIRWDDIDNTNLLSKMDKESKKSVRSFKKVTVRRKCSEGTVVKYLLDFGKRRSIPDIVVRHGSMLEDSSSERKKYWLEESHVPLHLLKVFEEKRIARKSKKKCSGKLREGSRIAKKPFKKKGFSYLFSRAEKFENYLCGHCNKDVLISEAVSCQYCKGFFHKRHVRMSSESIITEHTYTCHKCVDGKSQKIDTKKGKSKSTKRKRATKILKPLGSSKGKSLGKGKKPVQSQNSKEVSLVVPLRRSARNAKRVFKPSVLDTKIRRQKTVKKAKSRKSILKMPKNNSWRKKRTPVNGSYWLNGLRLTRKINDERVTQFRSKMLLVVSGETIPIGHTPLCSLCGEEEFTSELNYVACENCKDWFHGDAFNLDADKHGNLIGFKCHKCLSKRPPVCPHVCATGSGEDVIMSESNAESGAKNKISTTSEEKTTVNIGEDEKPLEE